MDDKEYYSLMNRSSSWALQQALKKKSSTKKALSQAQKTELPDNAQTFTSLELRQGSLSFSAAFDAGNWLALVKTVRDILLVDIPVARLDFLDKVTLRAFAIAKQARMSHIVSQNH